MLGWAADLAVHAISLLAAFQLALWGFARDAVLTGACAAQEQVVKVKIRGAAANCTLFQKLLATRRGARARPPRHFKLPNCPQDALGRRIARKGALCKGVDCRPLLGATAAAPYMRPVRAARVAHGKTPLLNFLIPCRAPSAVYARARRFCPVRSTRCLAMPPPPLPAWPPLSPRPSMRRATGPLQPC